MSGCAGAHPFLRRAFSESESKMKPKEAKSIGYIRRKSNKNPRKTETLGI